MKKYKVGFVQGVFDMFHIGHLNLLEKAKQHCDYLIVGVNSDELVKRYKNKIPIIEVSERVRIVEALRCVNQVCIMDDRDKIKAQNNYKFDVIFMGDDWKDTDFYNKIEKTLKCIGVDIVYFPYTKGTSSTILKDKLLKY